MKLGIFGGTFGPVHLGHIRAAHAFLNECALDRLYILPTAIPPHKAASAQDQPGDRLNMLHLAFSQPEYADDRITVSDYEQTRGGKSYTILTLEHFAKESDDITLLCGTDMFLTLERWYRGEDILRMADICCLYRDADPASALAVAEAAARYRAAYGTHVILPSYTPLVISSTEIRARIANQQSTEGLLPSAVRSYIDEHGLYRV
ncbi:MAG: nicotinate (nicotinamide) nucleotide adenylyltransferase [Ruminococcaceae bacterium]|nr:nicotinate (nicotinamide) nucleotide adenylyltransferase [Oscillospiraceae bacterium]